MKKVLDITDLFPESIQDFIIWIKYSIYAAFVGLGIPIGSVAILSKLMIFDSILGVIKAIRLGQVVSIKKLLWGFVTKLLILIVPLIVALISKELGENFIWALEFVLKILIINEGLSNLTNILAIKTKKNIKNIDLFTILIEYIRKSLLIIASKLFGKSIQESIEEIKKED